MLSRVWSLQPALTGLSTCWSWPKNLGGHSPLWSLRVEWSCRWDFCKSYIRAWPCRTSQSTHLKRWRWDRKTRVSCCPICMYVIKNDYAHFWITSSSGTTGAAFPVGNAWSLWHPLGSRWKNTSLSVVAPRRQARKDAPRVARHLGCGAQSSHKSGHKPKKGKKDKVDKDDKCSMEDDKPCWITIQVCWYGHFSRTSPGYSTCHSKRILTGSTSGHHKKSKKRGKKSHKKSH